MKEFSRHTKQAGVALVTALLVVALATVAATAMATRQHVDIRRGTNVIQGDQAYLYALGVESWATEILVKDRQDNGTDHLKEVWATVLPPIEIEGGQVTGKVEDLQGRYNVNNLVNNGQVVEAEVLRYRRLLTALGLEPTLAEALVDWLDTDNEPRPKDGAEDEMYLNLPRPYRAANAPLSHPSELRLLRGYTAKVMEKLLPYISTLPVRGVINVNTAPAEVFMALGDNISLSDAQALMDDRGPKGYESVAAFLSNPAIKDRGVTADGLSTASDFFLVRAQAQVGVARAYLESVVHRDGNTARTLAREQGVY